MRSIDFSDYNPDLRDYLIDLNKKGSTRDIKWLKEQAKCKKFESWREEEYFKNLETLFPVLNEMFKDKWDILIEPWTTSLGGFSRICELNLVILFTGVFIGSFTTPGIHNAKDLLVVIPLGDPSEPFFGHIHLSRLTLSYLEWEKNYLHSNTIPYDEKKGESYLIPMPFHGGDMRHFNQVRREMKWNLSTEKVEELFNSLIPMITVELDGNYGCSRFSDLKRHGKYEYHIDDSEMERGAHEIMTNYKFPIDFNFHGKKLSIKRDKKFENKVNEIVSNSGNFIEEQRNWPLLSIKGEDKEYFYDRSINFTERRFNRSRLTEEDDVPFIYLQGRKYEFNILPPTKEDIACKTPTVSSKFLSYLENRINECINYKLIINQFK